MRPQRLVGLIIFLTSLTLILAARYWYLSRIFVPLDQPISLAQGQIDTPEFEINLGSNYWINIELDGNYVWEHLCNANIRTRWKLSSHGRTIRTSVTPWSQSGVTTGLDLEGFEASPGTYRLQLEFLSDASCLDHYRPRLQVYTFSDRIYDNHLAAIWILSFILIAGVVLVVRSYLPAKIAPEVNLSVTGSESFEAGTLMRHRKPRREPRKFSDIPSFGLIASWALLMVLIPVWIINTWLNFTHESQGVLVYMPGLHPQIQIPPKDDFPVLRLEGNGNEIRFLVNSKPVANHEVKDLLNSALKVRKARFVYLSVDPELDYSDAAQAIDIIRSVKAEVILYTPKMGGPEFKPPKPQSSRPRRPVK